MHEAGRRDRSGAVSWRPAVRTCTTRRATSRSKPVPSSPAAARRAPWWPTPFRAGYLREDELLYTGKVSGQFANMFPMPVTADVMARGQERYNVFCSPCHGGTGVGNGIIVQRGFRQPPSYRRAAAARRAGRLLLRCDDERLWRDAGLRGPGAGRGSLGNCRLHPGAAAQSGATVADVPADRRADLDRPAQENQ